MLWHQLCFLWERGCNEKNDEAQKEILGTNEHTIIRSLLTSLEDLIRVFS